MKTSIKNIKERIRNSIKESIKVAVIALAITLGITYAYAAWTGPTATPPNNNVNAPINVGTVDQIKNAGLGVNSFAVFGNSNLGGYVKIGTTTATCNTSIEGSLRYDSANKNMEVCDGTNWANIGGSGGGTGGVYTGVLISGSLSGSDCSSAGGVPIDTGNNKYICKFS